MKMTLGTPEKLKSRKQIEELFIAGLSVKEFPIRMKFLKIEANDSPIKVAFSVPKRNFKLAVDRNRLKRLLREAYRKNKNIITDNLGNNYVIMFIYTDRTAWKATHLEQKMISLLKKFVRQTNTTL